MTETNSAQKHIAVFAFPFGAHAQPLLTLVQRLSEAAPHLNFSFFSTAESNGSLFSGRNELEYKKIKPYNVDSGLPESSKFNGNHHEEVEHFLKATPANFERALETVVAETGTEISCLIADAFLYFAAEMAEKTRVPWIPLWLSGPRSLLVHVETEHIREIMGINGPGRQTLEFLPEFSSIRAMDIPEGIISGRIDSPFSVMLHKMGKTLPKATAVATNSFEELDLPVAQTLRSKFGKLLHVGPLTFTSPSSSVSDPHGCLEWINEREKSSVIYISFGTAATIPTDEVTAIAEALKALGFPFLWSFRGNAEEQLPKGFVERTRAYGKIVPWAPQLEVLAHSSVGAFVNHGGWNSVVESIAGGVPMVCRPCFGDHGLNSRIVEAVWGIGLVVEGGKFTKDGTVNALKVVMSNEEGKRMRETISVLRRLAFKAVESDGSSTRNFEALVGIINKN